MTHLFDQAIQEAQAGHRAVAISLLVQVLRQNPNDDQAWLWLARLAQQDEERLYCLQQVRRIDPHNQTAVRGVQALEKRRRAPPPRPALPVPPAPTPRPQPSPPAEPSPVEEAPPAAMRPAIRSPWAFLLLLVQRLAFGALILLSIIFLSYVGLDMAGGTPLGTAAGHALSRTGVYVLHLLHGELGLSTAGGETLIAVPVQGVIAERLPRSLGLLGVSLLLAATLGVSLGVLAARGRSQRSLFILIATLIGVSVPSFFAAFLLQWAVTSVTRHVGRALLPVGGFGWDTHLVLPALVLAARPIAQITRITFVSVRQVLEQDYVRTAHSKGLRPGRVLAAHVLRNAAIPILTTIGISLRFSLSSLPVVELYFGWPGAGFTLLKGIAQQDNNLTVALALCLGTLFILVNLVLDLAYRLIDPRLWEKPAHVALQERQGVVETIRDAWAGLGEWITDNPITRWWRRRSLPEPEPLSNIQAVAAPLGTAWESRKRSSRISVLTNLPFVVGALLVLGLVVIVFVGPWLTPNDPYRTEGLIYVDGKLSLPPFPPSESYPWGTDILGRCVMSLLLSGAQQTLVLAVLAVAARTVVGVLLGAVAGWTNGGRLDRLILGTAEVISAFPTLLLAMILVLALGIRQGMPPFIIALCFVGWGEIMQFVRGEVTKLRPQPYVESAVAAGARTARILGRHILPNLFSALIPMIALEMGSVLMVLGELGFISIFIGGGTLFHLPSGVALYSDVPEWGALLANIRYQARSYPWTALYPMLAFFVAIMSFNLLGEGVRRLVQEGNLIIHRLVSWYTVAAVAVAAMVFGWLSNNSGALPYYQSYARQLDGEEVLAQVEALSAPEMEGRALGTEGVHRAAGYIAHQFDALGLQAGGQKGTWFQERIRGFAQVDTVPLFTLDDGGPSPVYREDFAPYAGLNVSSGQGNGLVELAVLGRPLPVTSGAGWRTPYAELDRADFAGNVLLALSPREARLLDRSSIEGLLVVADRESRLQHAATLSGRSRIYRDWFTEQLSGRDIPSLWISEKTAERLLAGSGYSLAEMREKAAQLNAEELFRMPLETHAALQVDATIEEHFAVQNVIAYIPGAISFDNCVDCMARYLVVVTAPYDSPPPGSDGDHSAANDNASGVAVMLEAARILQESDYEPFRSIMFIAYSGEGQEGGEPVNPSVISKFLQARAAFASFKLEAVIHVRGVGAGSGDGLEITAGSSLRLAGLVEKSARQMGVDVSRSKEAIDISLIYDDGASFGEAGQEAPMVALHWEGWEDYARLPSDTVENISAEKLEDAGRTLAMALMILGREQSY